MPLLTTTEGTPLDPAALLQRLTRLGYAGDADVAQEWLGTVLRALLAEPSVGDLAGRIERGDVDVESVADVVLAATLRVLRNPAGVKQESGSIDDWSEARSYADETQDVYFTAAELRRLGTTAADAGAGFSGSIPYVR